MDRKTNQTSRLPPLNALRAFETAARHRSFAMAAKELHVTPAAISHQVKGLEDHLGQRLFRRLKRGLELTRAGQILLPKLSEGFGRLGEAVEAMRDLGEDGALSVSSATSFATRWLAPRLHRFVGAHPELDVRINASTHLIDPSGDEAGAGDPPEGSPVEDADIAVRFGTGDYPGFRVDRLLAVTVTPMCSPRLLAAQPLRNAADLKKHVLIHDNVRADEGHSLWNAWFEAAGLPEMDTSHGLRFSHAMLALEAAADGMGVTLGISALAGSDLASGRAGGAARAVAAAEFAYYIVSGRRYRRARRRGRLPHLAAGRSGARNARRPEPAARFAVQARRVRRATRPPPLARGQLEPAAVGARDAVDDRQAEAGAAGPLRDSSRRVNGRFRRSASPAGTPGPRSSTSITVWPPSSCAPISTGPGA
jgi:LysR family glycine cleavage system transcriptional activator